MGTIELVLLIGIGIVLLVGIYLIFFSKKVKDKIKKEKADKKSKKNTVKNGGEKKVEQAIKTDRKPEEKPKQEASPAVATAEPELEKKKSQPFKIIRKQSEVKINRKALKNGSRNPSITKVFENGKRVDEILPEEGSNSSEIHEDTNPINVAPVEDVGDFGFREPKFLEVDAQGGFKVDIPQGMPNRAPIIEDRTNFTQRLNVSEDNNLLGVSIVGTQHVVEKVEKQTKDIDQKTADIVEVVRKRLLGERAKLDISFGAPYDATEMQGGKTTTKKSAKEKLQSIDAETLMIVDAINNPKHKK